MLTINIKKTKTILRKNITKKSKIQIIKKNFKQKKDITYQLLLSNFHHSIVHFFSLMNYLEKRKFYFKNKSIVNYCLLFVHHVLLYCSHYHQYIEYIYLPLMVVNWTMKDFDHFVVELIINVYSRFFYLKVLLVN